MFHEGFSTQEIWFQNLNQHMESTTNAITRFMFIVGNAINKETSDVYTKPIIIVSIVISLILFSVLLLSLVRIRGRWQKIVHAMNAMPQAAIQNAIERYQTKGTREFGITFKAGTILKDRSLSTGFPLKAISLFFSFIAVVFISTSIVIIFLTDVLTEGVLYVPEQILCSTQLVEAFYHVCRRIRTLMKISLDYFTQVKTEAVLLGMIAANPPNKAVYEAMVANSRLLQGSYKMQTAMLGVQLLRALPPIVDVYGSVLFGAKTDEVTGLLGPKSKAIDFLLRGNNDFVVDPFYDTFVNGSLLFLAESCIRLGAKLGQYALILNYVDPTDPSVLTVIYSFTHEITPKELIPIIVEFEDLLIDKFGTGIDLAIMTIVVFGFLAILFILVSVLIFKSINTTFATAISFLSAIPAQYVTTCDAVVKLLGNNGSEFEVTKDVGTYYRWLYDITDCLIIKMNEKAAITTANRAVLELFDVKLTDIVGLRIEQFILFDNEALVKHLQQIGNDEKKAESVNAEFKTSVNLGNRQERGFSAVFRGAGEECVLALSRSQEAVDLADKVAETTKKIEEIIMRVFPHDTRGFFKTRTTGALSVKRCMIVGVRLLAEWEDLAQDTEKCTAAIGSFRSCAYKASAQNEDCVIFKVLGMSLFAAFNVRRQDQAMTGVFKAAKQFLTDCFKGFMEKGLRCCGSIVYTKGIIFGRISELSANFNGYSVEIRDCCRALDIEIAGSIAVSANCADKISNQLRGLLRKEGECELYGVIGLLYAEDLMNAINSLFSPLF
jgi:PAS domain-containing protein